MRFVSKSVVTGFVNALAILIFMAQLPELTDVTWHVYAMTAAGLGIIYLFPYIPKIGQNIPSPLVCIVLLTGLAMYLGLDVRTVGDMGELPDTLPIFLWPDVPLNFETLKLIFPYSAGVAVVGLFESLMTATIVDELTDTESDRDRACKGQGIANTGAGGVGGMAGCAMIGQSVIKLKWGGRGRLATVAVVVYTHNLALGVLAGVLLATLFFANKIGRIMVVKKDTDVNALRYEVIGQVFFASSEKFLGSFDYSVASEKVVIDVSRAHFWDVTSVSALDKVVVKYQRLGAEVEVIGMNEASKTVIDRFAFHDDAKAVEKLISNQ